MYPVDERVNRGKTQRQGLKHQTYRVKKEKKLEASKWFQYLLSVKKAVARWVKVMGFVTNTGYPVKGRYRAIAWEDTMAAPR